MGSNISLTENQMNEMLSDLRAAPVAADAAGVRVRSRHDSVGRASPA